MKRASISFLIIILLSFGINAQVKEYDINYGAYSSFSEISGVDIDAVDQKPILKFYSQIANGASSQWHYIETKIATLDSLRNEQLFYQPFFIQNSIRLTSNVHRPVHVEPQVLRFSDTKGLLITRADNYPNLFYLFGTAGKGLIDNSRTQQATLDDLLFIDSLTVKESIKFRDKIILSASTDGTADIELAVIDSNYNITDVVINALTSPSTPLGFMNWGDSVVFFAAETGPKGIELYRTDGTQAGTMLVKDINLGTDDSRPAGFIEYNGKVYFIADNGDGGELWVTNGTSGGTYKVVDLNPNGSSSMSYLTIGPDSMLYFTANDTAGYRHLFQSDGTAVGTTRLYPNVSLESGTLRVFAGELFFRGSYIGSSYGPRLMRTDNITGGIIEVYGANLPHQFLWVTLPMVVSEPYMYFTASDTIHRREVYRTDGTTAGTVMLGDFGDQIVAGPTRLTAIPGGGLVYAHYNSAIGDEIYIALPESDTSVGVNNIADGLKLSVLPNPAGNAVTISTNRPDEAYALTLIDITGKLIDSRTLISTGGRMNYERPNTASAPGMYFLQVKSISGSSTVLKVIYH